MEENEVVFLVYGGFIIGYFGIVYIIFKYKEKINCIFYVINILGLVIFGLKVDIFIRMCMNK